MYKINENLLIYPKTISGKRKFIAEVKAGEPPLFLKDYRLLEWIHQLGQNFSSREAQESWGEIFGNLDKFASVFALFIQSEIFKDLASSKKQSFENWKKFGWQEASVYHEATRDYPFLKMDEPQGFIADEEKMLHYKSEGLPPAIYQRFNVVQSTRLIKFKNDMSIDQYIEGLSSAQKLGLEGLSVLFDGLYGERYQHDFGSQGCFLKKAMPSGGARHPLEVFMVWFGNPHVLSPGCYHYNV